MVEDDKMKMKLLAQQIKVFRAKKSMNQEDLAVVSGLSPCTIALIESCKKKPRVETLVKIAKALGVEENELLCYIL